MGVENKRHTNAHQPPTSLSTTEASIPPSPPDFITQDLGVRKTAATFSATKTCRE
jgi:hypothetical protein